MSLFDWLRDDPGRSALAGAAGGLIRWVSLRERWTDGMVSILVGSICAVYLGPLALPIMEPVIGRLVVDGSARSGLAGFVVGLMGIGLAGFIMDMLKAARTRVGGSSEPPKTGGPSNVDGQ